MDNVQLHHRVNFPCSVTGKMASAVCPLVFKRMTDIEERFATNGDDRRAVMLSFLAEPRFRAGIVTRTRRQ